MLIANLIADGRQCRSVGCSRPVGRCNEAVRLLTGSNANQLRGVKSHVARFDQATYPAFLSRTGRTPSGVATVSAAGGRSFRLPPRLSPRSIVLHILLFTASSMPSSIPKQPEGP